MTAQTTVPTQTGGALSGLFDSAGAFIRDVAPSVAQFYASKEQAKATEAQARAQAEAARLSAAAGQPAPGGPGGGIPPAALYIGAAVLGLGVIVWAATRK